jgi:hypothetical protein
MHKQSAAPKGGTFGRGSIIGRGRADHTPLPESLPAGVIERLHVEGVHTLADWRALGRRRFELWGVTRATANLLDILARGAP